MTEVYEGLCNARFTTRMLTNESGFDR
jgi:hypothetical protein